MESVLMQGHLLKELLYSITSILDRAEAACNEHPVNISIYNFKKKKSLNIVIIPIYVPGVLLLPC